MFGKLLKYEFKSLGKWYLSLYALVLTLSVVIGIWIKTLIARQANEVETFNTGPLNAEGWLFGIILFAFAFLIIGLSISTFLMIVNRFYKNVYGRQGYLTLTLPVTSHQIILSKFVAAILWITLASLTITVSIGIIALLSIPADSYPEFWAALEDVWFEISKATPLSITLLIINSLLDTVSSVFLAYFAISLGQLFKDYRVLMSFVSYFAISFVIGTFSFILMVTTNYSNLDSTTLLPFSQPLDVIRNLILITVFYFGTHHILTKKANLQ